MYFVYVLLPDVISIFGGQANGRGKRFYGQESLNCQPRAVMLRSVDVVDSFGLFTSMLFFKCFRDDVKC